MRLSFLILTLLTSTLAQKGATKTQTQTQPPPTGKQPPPQGGKEKGAPFLTIGTAYQFVKDSVLLSFDIGCYGIRSIQKKIGSLLPPDISAQLFEHYQKGTKAAADAKTQYYTDDIHNQILNSFTSATEMIQVVVVGVYIKLEGILTPVQHGFDILCADFHDTYPDAPSLPEHLVDRIFIVLFLFYIFYTVCRFNLKIICLPCKILGICCGRSAPAKRGSGRYANKNKKNN